MMDKPPYAERVQQVSSLDEARLLARMGLRVYWDLSDYDEANWSQSPPTWLPVNDLGPTGTSGGNYFYFIFKE